MSRPHDKAVEVPDGEDAITDVQSLPFAPEPTRPKLKRRITRPSSMVELRAGTPVGEYEIEAQIGEGAMGTVFSAIHPLIGKKVAIKVLKPELCANQASIDRFVQEAQAVNKIGHPNIVDVFSLGELLDGRAYFVMEWLRGEDLKTRLARGPISVADATDILDGIARALDAAHAKEIVHRDLKPDNVFLHQVDNGPLMVKLLDFGIAKLQRATPGAEKTQTGNMLGTPRYISPEQARGIHVDHRSDIYSLGVMAFEMLGGRPPFNGETAMDLVMMHLSEPPPPLSQFAKVPRSLEECVMAMLAKDPAGRPTLDEVRQILIDPTRRMTPMPRTMAIAATSPRALPRWAIVTGAVGAILAGLVTWSLLAGGSKGSRAQPTGAAPAERPQSGPTARESSTPSEQAGAPSPTTARSVLEVRIEGATDAVIHVDGEVWGRGAAVKVELVPGTHELIVEAPGRDRVTQTIAVKPGPNSATIVVPPAPAVTPKRPRPTSRPGKRPTSDDELLAPKRD